LPPRFDPDGGTPAGDLLQQRLDDFVAQNPGLRIEVRIKSEDTLVRSLETTDTAAPAAMPDLVLLSRTDLESAAAQGVLYTFDGLIDLAADPDWYPYARTSARIQNAIFGIPFAADMLTLIYRPGRFGAFTTWDEFQGNGGLLSFPASDPQALFMLSMYQSLGGLVNIQSESFMEEVTLSQTMQFFETMRLSGSISPLLTQYLTDEQSYQAFREGRVDAVVTWSNRYLDGAISGSTITPLPGVNGELFTLANTWAWSLTTDDPDRQALVIDLVRFLLDPEFMSEWTFAAGYLPPRPSALDHWTNANLIITVGEMSNSAQMLLSADARVKVGIPLSEALGNVLKGQTTDEVMPTLMDKLK